MQRVRTLAAALALLASTATAAHAQALPMSAPQPVCSSSIGSGFTAPTLVLYAYPADASAMLAACQRVANRLDGIAEAGTALDATMAALAGSDPFCTQPLGDGSRVASVWAADSSLAAMDRANSVCIALAG